MRDLLFPPWRWGVFHRKRCGKALILQASKNTPYVEVIYTALEGKGFRETIWQYVYRGQIGGLVRSYGQSLIEVHVRFFDDGTIYSEVEIGRTGLGHFNGKRIYGNLLIFGMLRNSISPDAMTFLNRAVLKHKNKKTLFHREWQHGQKFIERKIIMKFQLFFGSWVFITILMFLSTAITVSNMRSIYAVIVPALIFLYVISRKNKF